MKSDTGGGKWLQLSLREMLLAIAVVALLCVIVVQRNRSGSWGGGVQVNAQPLLTGAVLHGVSERMPDGSVVHHSCPGGRIDYYDNFVVVHSEPGNPHDRWVRVIPLSRLETPVLRAAD